MSKYIRIAGIGSVWMLGVENMGLWIDQAALRVILFNSCWVGNANYCMVSLAERWPREAFCGLPLAGILSMIAFITIIFPTLRQTLGVLLQMSLKTQLQNFISRQCLPFARSAGLIADDSDRVRDHTKGSSPVWCLECPLTPWTDPS